MRAGGVVRVLHAGDDDESSGDDLPHWRRCIGRDETLGQDERLLDRVLERRLPKLSRCTSFNPQYVTLADELLARLAVVEMREHCRAGHVRVARNVHSILRLGTWRAHVWIVYPTCNLERSLGIDDTILGMRRLFPDRK